MRKAYSLAAAFALALPFYTSAQSDYVAGLGGHQQVPSVATLGEGLVEVELSDDNTSVFVDGEVTGLSGPLLIPDGAGTAAHIHTAYTGSNGPISLELQLRSLSDPEDDGTYTAAFAASEYEIPAELGLAIREGRAYVNVHTETWPAGEVRGQLRVADLDAAYDAMLYGEQQNPPVLTDGMGGVMIEVTDDSMFVSGSVRVGSPLMPVGGTPAHLHFGMFGENGPVGIGLALDVADDGLSAVVARRANAYAREDGTVADVVGAIDQARNVYVNVHSEEFPAGEVRGQVVPYNSSLYMAYVSDVEPNPAPSSFAELRVLIEKPLSENSVRVSGTYSNWPDNLLDDREPAFVIADQSAGVEDVIALEDTRQEDGNNGSLRLQGFDLDDSQISQSGGLFGRTGSRVGFTTDEPGELRFASNIYHECKRAFHSRFTASQSVPSTDAAATGEVITEYYTSRIEALGSVTGLSGDLIDVADAGGMHIHDALAGRNGGIVIPVEPTTRDDGDGGFTLTLDPAANRYPLADDNLRERMAQRGFYYNVHTAQYPAGEVRGQIVPRANSLYYAPAAAGQAVPGYGPSPANGAILAELTNQQVTITGSFNELTGGYLPMAAAGSGAHLHGNVAGRAGGVLLPLAPTAEEGDTEGEFLPADNRAELSFGVVDSMLNRLLYLNIHSQTRPAGELRGQVAPLAQHYFHAKLSPDVTVPYTGMLGASDGQGHLHGEAYDDGRTVLSGSWDSLSTAIDEDVAGGAHIHTATVAEAGGIVFPIEWAVDSTDAMTAGDSTSATVPALANIGDRSPEIIAAMLAGDAYANIHTEGAPSGAIRGQVLASVNLYPDPTDISAPDEGANVDLGDLDSTASVTVAWDASDDPDAGQDVAYLWQLYADTAAAPLVQTQVDDTTAAVFPVLTLDTLLLNAGLAEGDSITLFHRASVTDGSLVTPGEFLSVILGRRGELVSVDELPAGSVRLLNTLSGRGGALTLEVGDLPAGELTYRITAVDGRTVAARTLGHGGSLQRYRLAGTPSESGMYALTIADERGRRSSWMFVVQ